MITKGQPITKADFDALAALATAKLGGTYAFPAFAGEDQLALPAGLTLSSAPTGLFDASRVYVRVYSYKTLSGVKTYSASFVFTSFAPQPSSKVTATWTAPTGPTAPDGYILAVVNLSGPGLIWRDMLAVTTLTEDGSFSDPAWKRDETLDADNLGNVAGNLPCGRGAWLKPLNNIFSAANRKLTLFGGATPFTDAHKVSGPWVVSVAQKCYLNISNTPVRKNLSFVYSEADSLTGNSIAREADMLGTYIGVVNGANNFNWDVNVKINGRIIIFSNEGENFADWGVSASHPGIAISFNAHFDSGTFTLGIVSAFIFDFTDVQFTVGTPVVLTCTPPSGHDVINPGNPFGSGGYVNAVFLCDAATFTATDTVAIHTGSASVASTAAKACALGSSLSALTLTDPAGGTIVLESHYRVFCNGVFVANTLATLGVMPFLDVDLPNYSPRTSPPASGRRLAMDDSGSLPFEASVTGRAALWPVLRDVDFTPDSVGIPLLPFNGSAAYQLTMATKFVDTSVNSDTLPVYEPGENLLFYVNFVEAAATDVRVLVPAGCKVYCKHNDFPSATDFEVSAAGPGWLTFADAFPSFSKDCNWFFALQNQGSVPIQFTILFAIPRIGAPYGSFFSLTPEGNPNLEGESYHFSDIATEQRPVPLYGYCVYYLNVRRAPVEADNGIATAPSAGTLDLAVDIGIMRQAGWDNAGTFEKLTTVTIPAGQPSASVSVFWPVLKGTPLAYKCPQAVVVRASANFQPMVQSQWFPVTSGPFNKPVGYYNGAPFYNPDRMLLFFRGGFTYQPILLPICATAVNDLEQLLNAL